MPRRAPLAAAPPATATVPASDPPLRPAGVRPPGKPTAPEARRRDITVAIREAFDVARRQLEDYARRKRGDIKRHEPDIIPEVPAE